MDSDPPTTALADPPADPPAWPPTQTPERAKYVRLALLGISSALIDRMLADLEHSTGAGGLSRSERLTAAAIRPLLPHLRTVFLGKLSEADPAGLERVMGATSTAIEQILAQAPGEPLDRWRWRWEPGVAIPELIPDTWTRADGS